MVSPGQNVVPKEGGPCHKCITPLNFKSIYHNAKPLSKSLGIFKPVDFLFSIGLKIRSNTRHRVQYPKLQDNEATSEERVDCRESICSSLHRSSSRSCDVGTAANRRRSV